MIKRAMAMVASAAVAAAPLVAGAQADTTRPPVVVVEPGTCDCPVGDKRGDLRGLAAFAPLGLLGALAAAGSTPGLFSSRAPDTPAQPVGGGAPASLNGSEVRISDPGRNTVADPSIAGPSLSVGNIPEPVPVDSMRGGLRAPNTGTALPAVFLLGSGLVAVGCVTLLRTRG
ncbi:MAG TPA: hypothetical protein VE861_10020 [Gemmatimonadaceae bacterium]|nr:hypothetical protein [Gemmatimonadaceae bacterium]